MDNPQQLGRTTVLDAQTTGLSWSAVVAGALTAAALTLLLIAFGAGLGLSTVSPWSGSGISASTFKVGTGIYLLVVAVMASALGGYLAARLRAPWTAIHTNEVFFRDTAHGLLSWALATILSATALGAVTSNIVGGAMRALGTGATQVGAQVGAMDLAVDNLFRADPAAAPATGATSGPDPARAEIGRLLTASFRDGGDLVSADRSYVTRLVATRAGLSPADAEKRVTEVISEIKQSLDKSRKASAELSLWLAASLLLGAFAASLAAVEGGQLRDGTWDDRKLIPRAL
jgi:hypothetical protein